MRILQVFHGENIGGLEKFCINLSNELSKTCDVYVLCPIEYKKYFSQSVIFFELDDKSRNNIFYLLKLYFTIRKISPNIIHAHTQRTIKIIKRLNFFLGIPFIVTKHDTQYKKAFQNIENAISISDDVTKTINAKSIHKIYNGVPYLEPNNVLLSNSFNIIAVGGLRKIKGFDILIQECNELNFDFHLYIIGDGEERANLLNLIKSLDMERKVSLLGFKNNINDYLHSADLQVISSYSEGFSLSMIEGVFYSKVLLSTRVSGSSEVLDEMFLCEQNKLSIKIKDIYDNYMNYKKSFLKIKSLKNNFYISTNAKKHIELYKIKIK